MTEKSVWHIVKEAAKIIGVAKVSPHDLRRMLWPSVNETPAVGIEASELWIDRDGFAKAFAADADPVEARVMAAVQKPLSINARRIASFDRRAVSAAKNLVNQVSLPSADRLLDALNSFQTALTWPEAQQRIQALLERGLQREVDFENRWPEVLGTLVET